MAKNEMLVASFKWLEEHGKLEAGTTDKLVFYTKKMSQEQLNNLLRISEASANIVHETFMTGEDEFSEAEVNAFKTFELLLEMDMVFCGSLTKEEMFEVTKLAGAIKQEKKEKSEAIQKKYAQNYPRNSKQDEGRHKIDVE